MLNTKGNHVLLMIMAMLFNLLSDLQNGTQDLILQCQSSCGQSMWMATMVCCALTLL